MFLRERTARRIEESRETRPRSRASYAVLFEQGGPGRPRRLFTYSGPAYRSKLKAVAAALRS
jgi:hypothetical protein